MADNKDKKVLNVPALRFPEFSGEWEKYVLTEFVERVTRRNKGNECKLPLTISAQYGLVDQITFFNKIIASDDMSNYYLLTNGDFAYNKSYSSEYPWGAIKRLDRYEYGALSSLYICFRPLNHVSSDFLTHYFETKKWHQGISEIAVEGARNHGLLNIGIQDFFATKHYLPQSILEQEKIACFLNLIEERIRLQNKIIEKLETLIKGIIETVISSQKPNTLIKNCLECNSSTLQESQVAETGTFSVYGATGISGYTETADINGESILIIKDGSSVGIVKFVTGEYSYIGTLNSLIAKDGYCLKYIYFALQRFSFEPYKTGMAIPHIYFKDYGKAKIYCPSLSLQTLIAQKLSLIENKMEVEKRIILCYQLQKSYLLSRMFI